MNGTTIDSGFDRAIREIQESEIASRRKFLSESSRLKLRLEAPPEIDSPIGAGLARESRVRLVRQVAAGLLAIGMPTTIGIQAAIAQNAKTPATATSSQETQTGELKGTVLDQTGAVIPNATVTVTNTDTGASRTLKTNSEGRYSANELVAGHYSVKVESPGFKAFVKTGIVLTPGQQNSVDVTVQVILDAGCCEYAASPLQVQQEDLILKKKPFNYTVGDAKDHNTLQGIAKLVYGDPKAWVPIFEANRDVIQKPGFIPFGTSLLIPPRKRSVPKLLRKVEPEYPAAAKNAHISGDVVMDVTLRSDGAVSQVNVIDGPAELVDAATTAVKQWQYHASSGDQPTRSALPRWR